jgi:Mycothiol maleylpyruvate isomerase N-terminal domain
MTTTTTDVATITPLAHQEAMRLQAHKLERTLRLLRSLDQASWAAATDCPAWDIRAMYQHVLGAREAGASMRENIRQLRRARAYRRRHGGPLEAALSAAQVSDRADLSPAQITLRLEAVAPKTVRGRGRTPAFVRQHARPAHHHRPLLKPLGTRDRPACRRPQLARAQRQPHQQSRGPVMRA